MDSMAPETPPNYHPIPYETALISTMVYWVEGVIYTWSHRMGLLNVGSYRLSKPISKYIQAKSYMLGKCTILSMEISIWKDLERREKEGKSQLSSPWKIFLHVSDENFSCESSFIHMVEAIVRHWPSIMPQNIEVPVLNTKTIHLMLNHVSYDIPFTLGKSPTNYINLAGQCISHYIPVCTPYISTNP